MNTADPKDTMTDHRVHHGVQHHHQRGARSHRLSSVGFHTLLVVLAASTVLAGAKLSSASQPGLNPGEWSFEFEDADRAKVTTAYEIEGGGFVVGQPVDLAITYTIADDWHMYWPGLNDSGPGPIIKFELPEGWTAGEPRWPPPHRRYVQPGNILDHIYERTVTVLIPITAGNVPPSLPSEPSSKDTTNNEPKIGLSLEWLVCEDVCIAESTEHEIPVVLRPASDSLPDWSEAKQAKLDAVRASIPPRVDHTSTSGPVRVAWASDAGEVLVITVPGARSVTLYPWADGAWPISTLREGHAEGERLSVRFHPFGPSSPPVAEGTDASFVRALVRADFGAEKPVLHVEVKVPRPGVVLPVVEQESALHGNAGTPTG